MMLAVLPDEQAPWSMKSAPSAQTHSGGRQTDDWLWIPLLWIRDLCPEFIYYFAQWPLNLSASGNSISKHPAKRFLSAMLPLSEHSAEKMEDMQQLPGKDPRFTPCYLFLVDLKRMESCQPFVSFLIHSFTFLSLFPKICLWKMLVCFLRN